MLLKVILINIFYILTLRWNKNKIINHVKKLLFLDSEQGDQLVMVFASKSNDLSFTSRLTLEKTKTDFNKLAFDIYMHAVIHR